MRGSLFSAKAEYACIAMLELAVRRGDPGPARLKAIAEMHGIPKRFLVQILLQLKAAGLVASTAATTTINYVTATGGDQSANLSNTNLDTQGNAQNTEAVLNQEITYVAAQDGYIGAQINTLNAISQVMSTQQENIVSAQNAVQATDYASATSNMSKYEVLSQTGIAALAQANSVQQEVTKLLQ